MNGKKRIKQKAPVTTEILKLATNLAPFARLTDRFVTTGYTQGRSFDRALAKVAQVGGLPGVALGWPCQFKTGTALRRAVARHGLTISTLDANIYTDPRFKNGSLSNREPSIRRAAIARIKATIDAAAEAGAPDINLWPGHDGFDYVFQGHYTDAWKWMLESLEDIAAHNPRVPIGIEYKPKEPRANLYLANAGKALWLVNKLNRPHVGITVDFGHSLVAQENPAECAALVMAEGRLQQVHLNDNYRDWDHDLIPGAVHLWEQIEFFYWLRKLGYPGWMSIDCFPYRENGFEALQRASTICHKCWRIAGQLLEQGIETQLRRGEHLQVMGRLWELVKG